MKANEVSGFTEESFEFSREKYNTNQDQPTSKVAVEEEKALSTGRKSQAARSSSSVFNQMTGE
jgi:hypothetical protein